MSTIRIAVASLLAATLAAPRAALAAPSEYVEGEVLVKFRAEAAPQHRASAVAALDHAAVADLHDGWTQVRVRPGQSVQEALAAYAADPSVEYAQPNFIYRATAAPDDPRYGQLWGLKNTGQTISSAVQPVSGPLYASGTNPGTSGADVNVEPAWNVTTDCSGAIVAVLDTGVNYDHQDLAANMWDGGGSYPKHGWDFVDGDQDPMDWNGHGTHVAGTIGAVGNDGAGVTGVCWKARIMAVRVLDALGGTGTTATITQGINFAAARGAKVINMSLGGGGTDDDAFSKAIANAQAAGTLVVVAAGNYGWDNDAPYQTVYPCNFPHPNVLCVAALDQDFGLASFSNFGGTSVDVGAPGTNILSTWPGTSGVFEDTNTSGWTKTTTTGASGGGWGLLENLGTSFHVDPASYGSDWYNGGTDDRLWKTLPHAVSVEFGIAVDLAGPDWIRIACKASGGDPFAPGGIVLEEFQGFKTGGAMYGWGADVSRCLGASSTVGFQLRSSATSSGYWGVRLSPLTVRTLAPDGTSYNTIHGTSMATPLVAGLATLLRSYNPRFTYADTVNAIVKGGTPLPSLAGKTTSGKAIDAAASLAWIEAPTGLAYLTR